MNLQHYIFSADVAEEFNKEDLEVTMQTYLDLSEAKDWWNLEVKPCKLSKRIFITGHETQFSEQSVVLPTRVSSHLSMAQMQDLKATVKDKFNSNGVLLAIVAADSSVVYYEISDGLKLPEPPEKQQEKTQRRIRYQTRRKRRHMKFSNIAKTINEGNHLRSTTSKHSPDNSHVNFEKAEKKAKDNVNYKHKVVNQEETKSLVNSLVLEGVHTQSEILHPESQPTTANFNLNDSSFVSYSSQTDEGHILSRSTPRNNCADSCDFSTQASTSARDGHCFPQEIPTTNRTQSDRFSNHLNNRAELGEDDYVVTGEDDFIPNMEPEDYQEPSDQDLSEQRALQDES